MSSIKNYLVTKIETLETVVRAESKEEAYELAQEQDHMSWISIDEYINKAEEFE